MLFSHLLLLIQQWLHQEKETNSALEFVLNPKEMTGRGNVAGHFLFVFSSIYSD